MGNSESNIASIWDTPAEFGRDDDLYNRYSYNEDAERTPSHKSTPARTPARTAPPSPIPIPKDRENHPPAPAEASAAAEPSLIASSAVEEITSEAAQEQELTALEDPSTTVTQELNISKHQKTNQVAPEATATKSADGGTTVVIKKSHVRSSLRDVPFAILFIIHLLAVAAGIIFLNIEFIRDMNQRKLHNLERWFPQLGTAVITGGGFALLCQTLFRNYPKMMVRSILWACSLLTFGAALMLISTSVPANLGVGILCLIFSICQSLYACWVSKRVTYAADLLKHSLTAARRAHGTYAVSMWVLLIASLWMVFWSFGVVSALTFQLVPLVILAMLASLAWTLETLRNVVSTAAARGVAAHYLSDASHSHWDHSLRAAFTTWFGSICLGSAIVPILHVARVSARGLNRIHGDNEFMFSCADCFDKVTRSFPTYANNWAYVQVALHRKAFTQASRDTFRLFESKRLIKVIDKDLTSSVCVLSGIAGGMLCVLVSGGWTFGTHKALTSSVSTISFFIGYFLVRIGMAVPQGAVCAHYVCFADNSSASQELESSPVNERLNELSSATRDIENAKQT